MRGLRWRRGSKSFFSLHMLCRYGLIDICSKLFVVLSFFSVRTKSHLQPWTWSAAADEMGVLSMVGCHVGTAICCRITGGCPTKVPPPPPPPPPLPTSPVSPSSKQSAQHQAATPSVQDMRAAFVKILPHLIGMPFWSRRRAAAMGIRIRLCLEEGMRVSAYPFCARG